MKRHDKAGCTSQVSFSARHTLLKVRSTFNVTPNQVPLQIASHFSLNIVRQFASKKRATGQLWLRKHMSFFRLDKLMHSLAKELGAERYASGEARFECVILR